MTVFCSDVRRCQKTPVGGVLESGPACTIRPNSPVLQVLQSVLQSVLRVQVPSLATGYQLLAYVTASGLGSFNLLQLDPLQKA